ncbi:MAG: tRNA (adenosine(37)-N6)-threonylcarbamoyltransferase complex ATPase subunit type 1 TsaE [Bacteroidia bacterium]|nr:tRNA (adenosine(37)-N6)-threonylcarbamoyltransferase complex ATPase subunit type 1 TsaE [Bacteroidia bacterium]
MEQEITQIDDLKTAAKALLDFAGNEKVFLFYGGMGAGKTTFIKELCTSLGSTDNFSSPTYSIVNEYQSPAGKLFHFDFYRLKNATELLDIGIDEYLYSGNYCFIEWPQLAEVFLDGFYISVNIKVQENNRYLRASKQGT